MAEQDWRYTITLVDSKGFKSSLTYLMLTDEVTSDVGYLAALAGGAAVSAELIDVTDALIASETLSEIVAGASSLPGGAVDISDEAAVVCWLSEAAEVAKYHTMRIPAPVAALFEADGYTVDEANADLIAFIDAVGEDGPVLLSDGEAINTDLENGISHGFWRSVKKTSPRKN